MFLLEVLMEKRAPHAAASDVHRTAPNATAKPGVSIANARRLTLGEQNVENTEDCNAPAQPPRFPRLGHSGLGSRGSRYLAGHFSRRADKRANQHANNPNGPNENGRAAPPIDSTGLGRLLNVRKGPADIVSKSGKRGWSAWNRLGV